jgi:hypothetical protein
MSFRSARPIVIVAGLLASTASAGPFESVLTHFIFTLPKLDNRAVATIKVNPSSTRTFVSAGGDPAAAPGYMHLTIWNSAGGVQSFGAYDMPGISGGTIDVHSISESPSGDFYVAGLCSSSTTLSGSFVAKFNASLHPLHTIIQGATDMNDPRVEAIALSSGNIVLMDQSNPGQNNQAHTRMSCYAPNGQNLWTKEYTTPSCEVIHLADMLEESGGLILAVGTLVTSAGFRQSCVMMIDPDPSPTGAQGNALGLWVAQPSFGAFPEYVAAAMDSTGSLYAVGRLSFFAAPGPGIIDVLRATKFSPFSGMAAQTDVYYYNSPMLPDIGATTVMPNTFGGTWAQLEQLVIAGNNKSTMAASAMRLDPFFNLGYVTGDTFGNGAPSRFSGVAIDPVQPAETVFVGDLQPTGAGSDQAYIVRTGAFGQTSCSTHWSATRTLMTTTVTPLTTVSLKLNRFCNGTTTPFITGFQMIALQLHPFSASVTVKKKCDNCSSDLNGDQQVDDFDFVNFVAGYEVLLCTDPAMPDGCPADINLDGFVDDGDFVEFVVAYDALVCTE